MLSRSKIRRIWRTSVYIDGCGTLRTVALSRPIFKQKKGSATISLGLNYCCMGSSHSPSRDTVPLTRGFLDVGIPVFNCTLCSWPALNRYYYFNRWENEIFFTYLFTGTVGSQPLFRPERIITIKFCKNLSFSAEARNNKTWNYPNMRPMTSLPFSRDNVPLMIQGPRYQLEVRLIFPAGLPYVEQCKNTGHS
jgi:hypothetical protein